MSSESNSVDLLHARGSRRQRITVGPVAPRHRIGEVLQVENITLRCAADRMGINAAQARREADPACDLRLSDLHRWQTALKVPIADLVAHPSASLSPVIRLRASLLKAMRTVRSLQLHIDDPGGQSLSILLAQQLMEIMPELSNVSAWPVCGTRREPDELGAVADHRLPDNFFDDAKRV